MILVTRDQEKSIILAQKLRNKGLKTIICPLFKVKHIKVSLLNKILFRLFRPKTILITSSNSIDYLEHLKLSKSTNILSVGVNTTQNLKTLGYDNIQTANNSAESLFDLAKQELTKNKLALYLRGEIIKSNLRNELKHYGFKTKQVICYKIVEHHYIEENVIEKIHNHEISGITIYSKNTLLILHKLFLKHNLLEYCKEIKLLCLSEDIRKYSKELGFRKNENINKILQ
jgi:uroporphyrinogen-III synthase